MRDAINTNLNSKGWQLRETITCNHHKGLLLHCRNVIELTGLNGSSVLSGEGIQVDIHWLLRGDCQLIALSHIKTLSILEQHSLSTIDDKLLVEEVRQVE